MNANLSYFPKLRRHSLPNRDWANAPGNANVFRPNIYDPAQPDDQTALAELLDSGPLWQVHDTLPAQLEELAKSRHPRHKKMVDSSALVRNEIDEIVADCALEQFGRWIHYPWSGRLIRVLPPAEFRELRLDRNRNKLTHGEQQTLGKLRVGVVGLSVGNAIARAIALEGTCGALKLADHDHLELSNLNRIQAGLEHLDLPKPVIAARQILELDPYLDVSVVPEGLNDDNIEAFFDAPGLDLLIEECDDLRVKVALREHARRRQIPVFMETSDRGMLDVERFDQEPSRALLHGLLGPIGASDIPKPLTNDDKVKFALPFFGPSTLSPRMAASMLEIEESISSWPQLGGDVLLGGATVAAAVRAFGLNQPLQSGRRWVDLNRLISEPPAAGATLGESVDESTHLSDTQVARLVGAGTAAPSGGNSQPWRYEIDDAAMHIRLDIERAANTFDVTGRGALLALGASAENILLTAPTLGLSPQLGLSGHTPETFHAHIAFRANEKPDFDPRLVQAIPARRTSRTDSGRQRLEAAKLRSFGELATGYGSEIEWLTDADDLRELGDILGEGDRIRALCPLLHGEMFGEVRWTHDEAERSRDGLVLDSLGLTEAEQAGMSLLRRCDVAETLRSGAGAMRLRTTAVRQLNSASAVGLLSVPGSTPSDAFTGGRAIQHLWLQATIEHIGWHPMTALIYMFDLLDAPAQDTVFNKGESASLRNLRDRFNSLLPASLDQQRLMLFRLCDHDDSTVPSLRRRAEDVCVDRRTSQARGSE